MHFKAIFQTTYLVFSVYRIRICRRAFFEYFLQIKPKLRTLLSALQIIGKFFAELQIFSPTCEPIKVKMASVLDYWERKDFEK